jgi:hypothetical protein
VTLRVVGSLITDRTLAFRRLPGNKDRRVGSKMSRRSPMSVIVVNRGQAPFTAQLVTLGSAMLFPPHRPGGIIVLTIGILIIFAIAR